MATTISKGLVPNILNSRTFTTQRAALFIVFDEGNGYCPLNGSSEDCVYAVWIGPPAKNNYGNQQLVQPLLVDADNRSELESSQLDIQRCKRKNNG